MTQRLLLLARHAKSSWDNAALGDHQRPLNARGQGDAPRVGAHLRERGWVPQQTLSSDAMRTRQTWALMSPALAPDTPVRWLRDLYLAAPGEILAQLGQAPEACQALMVLGHNPGMEDLASLLSGQRIRMTTANVVVLRGQAQSWAQAAQGSWSLEAVVRPRELPA
jgi:phosphohistidine phosphatase